MQLHTVIVSWNRLALTRQTVESYAATVTLPHTLVVVDNGSAPDVQRWLLDCPLLDDVVLLNENRYPGFAANLGWQLAPPEATHLHRSDNDTLFLPGWCDGLAAAFTHPRVGLVGLTQEGDERWTRYADWPVGGNAVIRRDVKTRYSEEPWREGWAECGQFYKDVRREGWRRAWAAPGIEYLVVDDPAYYEATHAARGLPAPDRESPPIGG